MTLEQFLRQNKLWYRLIQKPKTIHTADAAKVAGIEICRITKNLVSETNEGEYVMLIVPGDRMVDLTAAAEALGVQSVHLVAFDQAEEISGYPPGGTPSIGHKTRMRTILDESVIKYETVFCGGGTRNELLELKTADILKHSNAAITRIAK
jgi:Cys-tRNA(Pro)/Cys-tRNA(Cys) deacylase